MTLLETPKTELVAYLLASRQQHGSPPKPLPRLASALVSQATDHKTTYTELTISLSHRRIIDSNVTQLHDIAPLDLEEMTEAEEWLLNDPDFIEVIKKLRLPEGSTIVADSWPVSAAQTLPHLC